MRISHLDGVNHSGDEHCKDNVTVEIAPLSYGATHYSGAGRSEGALFRSNSAMLLADDKVLTWKKKKAYFEGSRPIRTKCV